MVNQRVAKLWSRRAAFSIFDHHVPFEGMPGFRKSQETGKRRSGHSLKRFPELGIQIGQYLRRPPGDDLKLKRRVRTKFLIARHDGLEIDAAVPERCPLHCGASPVFVDRRIPHMRSDCIGAQYFERSRRVLHDVGRVAEVEIRADKIGARFFDHLLHLPGLQVFVVLDRDFYAQVECFRSHRFKIFNQRIHQLIKRAAAEPVELASHDTAHYRRPNGVRNIQAPLQNLLRRSILRIPTLRQLAHAACARIDPNAEFPGAVLYPAQSAGRRVSIIVVTRKLNGVESLLRCKIQVLHRIPFPGTERVGVVPQPDVHAFILSAAPPDPRRFSPHSRTVVGDNGDVPQNDELLDLISDEIRSSGPLTFARYMELALYHPEFGYYRRRDPFGKAGDFYTAAQLQPVFGELMAAFVERFQERSGMTGPFGVLELGAGRGDLGAALQPFGYRPYDWNTQPLPPHWTGVVFANEFFDALPVHLMERRRDEWFELFVEQHGGRLAFASRRASPTLREYAVRFGAAIPSGGRMEVCLKAKEWIERIAGMLSSGSFVLIDYGYEFRELARFPEGTLASYRDHRMHADVLKDPGLQDITAHVNFTWVRECAARSGFICRNSWSLAAWALQIWSEEEFERRWHAADQRWRMQWKQLVFGMGETFRVIEFQRNRA